MPSQYCSRAKTLGILHFFVQMSVRRNRAARSLVLCQQHHVDALVDELGLESAYLKKIPMLDRVYADAIHVIHHHVRERVNCGQVCVVQVSSAGNVAEVFTKLLPFEPFSRFRSALGVRP